MDQINKGGLLFELYLRLFIKDEGVIPNLDLAEMLFGVVGELD